MRGKICLVRLGNVGDVVVSQPTAASFSSLGWEVHLCTKMLDIGSCLASYHSVRPFEDYINGELDSYDRIHLLRYELLPALPYIQAMAVDAGVQADSKRPVFNRTFPRIEKEKYGLICPDTSCWLQGMRRWPRERFDRVQEELVRRSTLKWTMLEESHTFDMMMSLIAHADVVLTNDSAPVHIAQAFGRKVVCIFGATDPARVLYSRWAAAAVADVPCLHCRRIAKDRSMECSLPLCLTELSIDTVANAVLRSISVEDGNGLVPPPAWQGYGC